MSLTFFIAQLFGLLLLILSVSMFFHKAQMLEIFDEFVRNKALLFMVGIFNLIAGLAMVLSHNIWFGRALYIIVTLLGWLLVLRGVLLIWLPPRRLERFYRSFNLRKNYYTFTAAAFIVGLYLTFAGLAQ